MRALINPRPHSSSAAKRSSVRKTPKGKKKKKHKWGTSYGIAVSPARDLFVESPVEKHVITDFYGESKVEEWQYEHVKDMVNSFIDPIQEKSEIEESGPQGDESEVWLEPIIDVTLTPSSWPK